MNCNDRPNLLIITTDQQRYDALAANGNPRIQTPNLDKLADSGINLGHYFVNNPVCFPSRATLFTGRYPHSHKIRGNGIYLQSDREIHLFRVLKNEGYSIGYVGKNHLLRTEEFQNFDHADVWGYNHADFWSNGEGLTPGQKAYNDFEKGANQDLRLKGAWAGARFHDLPEEDTKAWLMADSAIDFLQSREGDEPFCLYLSFYEPHAPHVAPRRFESVYPPDKMPLPEVPEGELEGKPSRYPQKYNALKMPAATKADYQRFIAVYYSMVSFVDEQVGRVMDVLADRQLLDNTIVVYTSDHGDFCGDHGMVKKDTVHLDSLLHVPFLLSWPGKLASQRVDEALVEETDVMPTLLDLMGLEIPEGVQGQSFRPLLEGTSREFHEAVFAETCNPLARNPYPSYEAYLEDWHRDNPGQATPIGVPGEYTKTIRTSDWRYNWYASGEEELYEYATDPHEHVNRASDASLAETKTRLKLQLLEWALKSEDPLDPKKEKAMQERYPDWHFEK